MAKTQKSSNRKYLSKHRTGRKTRRKRIAAQNWTKKNERNVLYASKSQLFDSSFRFRACLQGEKLPLARGLSQVNFTVCSYGEKLSRLVG